MKEGPTGKLFLFAEGITAGREAIVIDSKPGTTLVQANELAKAIRKACQLRTVLLQDAWGVGP